MTESKESKKAELIRQAEERRKKKLAEELYADFEERRERRRTTESGWLLNMNFFCGNQYCDVAATGGLVEEDKRFYWQSRRAFNHIAPTVDTRLAKLTRMRPNLKVRAFSDEEEDVKAAKLSDGVLACVRERIGWDDTVSRATLWSEVCGSAFYKIAWDDAGGRQVGVSENGDGVFEGEVSVTAVSPFEIYPDSMETERMEELQSVIHAQVVPVSYLAERFGVTLAGKPIDEISSSAYAGQIGSLSEKGVRGGQVRENAEILIERYTKPSAREKDGKLEIAAGGVLLYEGPLPYKNGEKGERGFPFVKQDCMLLPGAFFGSSVIDRLIPVQRAYNAVRNRKHELLNRISLGVVAVEDGSVDTDELAEEGLSPGKILVYRQGGKMPEMLDCGEVPKEFASEEDWLEREFGFISGVSELSQNSMPSQVTSASGLRLLLTEDNARLSVTTDNICRAVKETGKQIIRLYRQFAGNARLLTIAGEDKKTQVLYFNASELSSSDIQFDTEEAITPEERKETIMTLLNAGLFSDEDGKISMANKHRILDAFGFGSYENARDISSLHIAKAEAENVELCKREAEVDFYDDHELHLTEHTRYLLGADFMKRKDEGTKKRFCAHMEAHEKSLNEKREKNKKTEV